MAVNHIFILVYTCELIVLILLMRSFVDIKWKKLLSPWLSLIPSCAILNSALETFFPALFGWSLAMLATLFTCKKVLNLNYSNAIFSFLLSYILYSLVESLAILAVPK